MGAQLSRVSGRFLTGEILTSVRGRLAVELVEGAEFRLASDDEIFFGGFQLEEDLIVVWEFTACCEEGLGGGIPIACRR